MLHPVYTSEESHAVKVSAIDRSSSFASDLTVLLVVMC